MNIEVLTREKNKFLTLTEFNPFMANVPIS